MPFFYYLKLDKVFSYFTVILSNTICKECGGEENLNNFEFLLYFSFVKLKYPVKVKSSTQKLVHDEQPTTQDKQTRGKLHSKQGAMYNLPFVQLHGGIDPLMDELKITYFNNFDEILLKKKVFWHTIEFYNHKL